MPTKELTTDKLTIESSAAEKDSNQFIQDAIESLHEACVQQNDEDFLKSAMYHFHRILNADYVIAGMISEEDSSIIETAIVLQRGLVIPNMNYEVKGTPCEVVVNVGPCVYPSLVIDLFPEDRFFRDKSIQGYVGTPLFNESGNCKGVIVGLSQSIIENPDTVLLLAKLFAIAISPIIKLKKP